MTETLLESLTAQVSEHVVSYVTTKILPAIAKKYNLSLDELLVVVRGIDNTPIKAIPKAKTDTTASAHKASLVASISKSKIEKARAEGKYLNIISGRPLGDSVINRRKYTFLEDLGIAGPIGDPLLEQIAGQLRGVNAEGDDGAPVHVQAAAAKAAAKVMTKPSQPIATPKPKVAAIAKMSMESAEENSSVASMLNEEDDAIPTPVPVPQKQVETLDDLSDETESGDMLPNASGKKATTKTSGAKELDSASEEDVVPVVTSLPTEDTVDQLVQIANAIDEHVQQPSPKFNTKLKRWWLPEYMYLLDKKKTAIVGKITPENTIIQLSAEDLQFCNVNNWTLGTFEG